jgi:hypothetical protein
MIHVLLLDEARDMSLLMIAAGAITRRALVFRILGHL